MSDLWLDHVPDEDERDPMAGPRMLANACILTFGLGVLGVLAIVDARLAGIVLLNLVVIVAAATWPRWAIDKAEKSRGGDRA